jgi:tRNA uridine 5-carboxymethylaminomethyl modification enzyme
LLQSQIISSSKLLLHGIKVSQDGQKRTIYQVLGLQGVSPEVVFRIFPNLKEVDFQLLNYFITESKYKSYLDRQKLDIEILKSDNIAIPTSISYDNIGGLSNEAKELFQKHTPNNLKEAGTIQGITPASIMSVYTYLKASNAKG